MSSLQGQVAIVTGAGKADGIGFASCRRLAQAGVSVVITDYVERDDLGVDLQARAAEIGAEGGSAAACQLDVTSMASIQRCIDQTLERHGHIDILFNNAGYAGGVADFLDIDDAKWEASWRVNVKGVADCCRAIIPVMQKQGGGAIINNSSMSGLGAVNLLSAYTATKYAVVGLTKALALEFGADNIRVNAVCPGLVRTSLGLSQIAFMRKQGQAFEETEKMLAMDVPLGQRWADPLEIGDAVVYLAGPQSAYVTGIALPVAGGLSPGLS